MYLDSKQHLQGVKRLDSFSDGEQDDKSSLLEEQKELLSTADSETIASPPSPQLTFAQKYYVLIAIAAGFCLGVQAFLNQVVVLSQHEGFQFSLFMPVFISFLLSSMGYYTKEQIVVKRKHGQCWSKSRSAYFRPVKSKDQSLAINEESYSFGESNEDKGEIKYILNWFNIIGMLARCAAQSISFFFHVGVMYTCTLCQVNFSLIINIYSITPFLVAVSFYIFFKEKLNLFHLIGMALILTNIIITAFSNQGHEDQNPTDAQEALPIIVPIILAICVAIFFTLTSLISRYVVTKGGFHSQQLIADGYIYQALLFIVILIILGTPYPALTIFEIGAISIIGTIGTYLINEAVVHGKAGPAQALMETQSLFLLLLEIFILGKLPNTMQIIGFVIGIIGGLFIAVDSIRNKGRGGAASLH